MKSRNHLFRFFINGFIFLIIILLFDQVTGRILRHYYFTSKSGANYNTTYSMDSTKAELIILGSSRASHHYIPDLIEDSLGISCYNTGRDGNFLFFNYAVFKSILKRYNPKIVLLDVNAKDLNKDNREKSYEGLVTLLPYYDSKPELRNIIRLRSHYEQYKLLLATYAYNSSIIAIGTGNLIGYINNNAKGYLPLKGSSIMHIKPPSTQEDSGEFDVLKVNVIDSMALICNQRDIRFLIVQSPRYTIVQQRKLNQNLTATADKYQCDYWNFVNDSLFINSPGLFKDGAHLNDDGAQLFTLSVIHKLKQ